MSITPRKLEVEEGKMKKMGRPNKYSPDELYTHALAYFKLCDDTIISVDKNGNQVKKPKTRSGLCIYLGLDGDYISEKDKLPEYKRVVSFIRQSTSNSIEEGMLTGTYNPSAAIFSLKNNDGWTDKIQTDNKTDNTITIKIQE